MIGAKLGTLGEVDTEWNLIDLLDANEYLDIVADQAHWDHQEASK